MELTLSGYVNIREYKGGKRMSTRFQIAVLLSLMINAVLFGTGIIIVLTISELAENAKYLIPLVIGCSFLITPFIAWFMAPRMRNRYWQNKNHKTGSHSLR